MTKLMPVATAANVELIGDPERGDAITTSQAKLVFDGWPLEDEWWSNPYLCAVHEYSQADIDRLRNESTSSEPTP